MKSLLGKMTDRRDCPDFFPFRSLEATYVPEPLSPQFAGSDFFRSGIRN